MTNGGIYLRKLLIFEMALYSESKDSFLMSDIYYLFTQAILDNGLLRKYVYIWTMLYDKKCKNSMILSNVISRHII